MVFGINGGEFVALLVIAAIVIGPQRLPRYAEQLAALVRTARGMAGDARARMREELGPELADVDWASLDPRRYDPRRIVRDALQEDPPADGPASGGDRPAGGADRPMGGQSGSAGEGPMRFDDEAT